MNKPLGGNMPQNTLSIVHVLESCKQELPSCRMPWLGGLIQQRMNNCKCHSINSFQPSTCGKDSKVTFDAVNLRQGTRLAVSESLVLVPQLVAVLDSSFS